MIVVRGRSFVPCGPFAKGLEETEKVFALLTGKVGETGLDRGVLFAWL